MKKLLLLFTVFAFTLNAYSQKNQKLEDKKGFKDIILGQDISTIKAKVKQFKNDPITKDAWYEYTDKSALKVGNLPLKAIYVNTFDGKISSIRVDFNKVNGRDFFSQFITAYGIDYERPNQYMEQYYWASKNVTLHIAYEYEDESIFRFFYEPLAESRRMHESSLRKKALDDL